MRTNKMSHLHLLPSRRLIRRAIAVLGATLCLSSLAIISQASNGHASSANEQINSPEPRSHPHTKTIAQAGRYVSLNAVGSLCISHDGKTWREVTLPFRTFLRDLTTGDGLFVAVGGSYVDTPGVILTSRDGVRWRVRQAGQRENPYSVVFAAGQFVAVGDSGSIWTSKNGARWKKQNSGSTACLFTVHHSGQRFVATGESGQVLHSSSGKEWTQASGCRNTVLPHLVSTLP